MLLVVSLQVLKSKLEVKYPCFGVFGQHCCMVTAGLSHTRVRKHL